MLLADDREPLPPWSFIELRPDDAPHVIVLTPHTSVFTRLRVSDTNLHVCLISESSVQPTLEAERESVFVDLVREEC